CAAERKCASAAGDHARAYWAASMSARCSSRMLSAGTTAGGTSHLSPMSSDLTVTHVLDCSASTVPARKDPQQLAIVPRRKAVRSELPLHMYGVDYPGAVS